LVFCLNAAIWELARAVAPLKPLVEPVFGIKKRFRGKSMQKEKIELNRNRTLPLGGSQYCDEQ
jgi:hypothetical protein